MYNGPRSKGECPSSLAPYWRISYPWSWVTPISLTRDTVNFNVRYNYSNPIFYKITPFESVPTFDEHYIFETRLRQGFDKYTPNDPINFSNQSGTLLIWHNNPTDGDPPTATIIPLALMICTDDNFDANILTDYFPKDKNSNSQNFNDITIPRAELGTFFTGYTYTSKSAHFALNGIHKLQDSTTLIDTIALKLTLAAGTISQNTTWQYDVRVVDDVTIQSGVNLTVMPGTNIYFNPGYTLTVNGKLIAKGTPTQRITFTSSSPAPVSGDWQGIICSGGGPDTLTYCNIKYAYDGLRLMNTAANSYMQNDTISRSANYGLFVSNTGTANTSLKMYKCGVKDNDGRAMLINNAKVLISYSRIENNELQSIGVSNIYIGNGGRVYMDSTRIQNNIGSGIDVSGVNSRVSLSIDEIKRGYNTVTRSGVGKIYVHNSATAFLGYTASIKYCRCDETSTISASIPDCPPGCYWAYRYETRGGWNNVYNNGTYTGRLINNATTTTVQARYTYWGTHQPNEYVGPVDTLYQLGSAVSTLSKATFTPPDGELFAADLSRQRMIEWLKQLKNDIEESRENAIGALYQLALHAGPGGFYQDALPLPWETFLIAVETSSLPAKLRMIAAGLRLQSKLDVGQFDGAINLANQLLSRNGISNDEWLYYQVRKIFASVGKGDGSGAWLIFNGIKEKGISIDSNAIKSMKDYLNIVAGENHGKFGIDNYFADEAAKDKKTSPKTYRLEQNYPNPFNPVTEIRYEIPIASHVVLKIYDVLGREVSVLVDEVQDVGYKSVNFNANILPSGVYFYRLQAGRFSDIKKMLILR